MNKVLAYMAMELPTVMVGLSEGRAIAGDATFYVDGGDDPQGFAKAIWSRWTIPRAANAWRRTPTRADQLFDWETSGAFMSIPMPI